MTDRVRYCVSLALAIGVAILSITTCGFAAAHGGLQAMLSAAIPVLPCLAFCTWRAWVMRDRLRLHEAERST
ncbi:hypothetical protein BH09ACT12_BH09ACT12_19440 [soil metagenome]